MLGNISASGLGQCNHNKMELFYNDTPLTLARWPNINATTGYWEWAQIISVQDP